MNALKVVTQVVQDLSEIIIIVGAAWAAIRFKDIVVAYIQNAFLGGEGSQAGANRLLKSVASLMDYGIYISAGFAVIAAFGINVTPLMASLGGASVVIGLASQSILGNVASAVTLVRRHAPAF